MIALTNSWKKTRIKNIDKELKGAIGEWVNKRVEKTSLW